MNDSKPIVLVLSVDANVTPQSVIERIRKEPDGANQEPLLSVPHGPLIGHRYHIHTKYYDKDIVLHALAPGSNLDTVPSAILERTEGILIYFDAGDRGFLDRLPAYVEFVEEHEIELGILLCKELADDCSQGVTYGEAKRVCNVLDVIELDPSGESEDGEAVGVDELIQAMHNFIWSKVQIKQDKPANGSKAPLDEEAEMQEFENLVTQVVQFLPNTSTWSRNERLAYAQEFAEIFDDLIGEDD